MQIPTSTTFFLLCNPEKEKLQLTQGCQATPVAVNINKDKDKPDNDT